MRFSLNLRYILSIYCCQILENIKIIGPYKEEIWTPKHWTCNITTGRQLCPKISEGGVYIDKSHVMQIRVPVPFLSNMADESSQNLLKSGQVINLYLNYNRLFHNLLIMSSLY